MAIFEAMKQAGALAGRTDHPVIWTFTPHPAPTLTPRTFRWNGWRATSILTQKQKIGEASPAVRGRAAAADPGAVPEDRHPSKFSDDSTAASIYQDMVTKQLADSISKSGTARPGQDAATSAHPPAHPTSPAGHDRPRKRSPPRLPARPPPGPIPVPRESAESQLYRGRPPGATDLNLP